MGYKLSRMREYGNPKPRLDVFGYTLKGGSPTRYQVEYEGRWRRVYVILTSNVGTHVIRVNGKITHIRPYLHDMSCDVCE